MTSQTNPPALSRRALLLGAGGVALTLAGCNASARNESAAGPASSTAAGFSYTDARGKKIELATVPTVVVAQSSAAAALWDFGFKVKGAYGELKSTDGKLDFQAGNLQLSEITVIGSTYGEFNLEKYAAMGPQLLIDESFDDKTLWYVPEESAAKIEAVAPTLGFKMLDLNQLQIIEKFGELAGMLGADINSPAVAESKVGFEAASARVKTAAAARPLKVLAVSRDAQKVWIANPAQHPDLAYLTTLGVSFVQPKVSPKEYFLEISYEELDKYSGDLIIDDARGQATRDESMDDQATWKALPAVKSGQVYEWKPAAPYSYLSSAPLLDAFATALTSSEAAA